MNTVLILYFYEDGDLKTSVVLKCESSEQRDDTSIVDRDQEGVKC